MTSASNQQITRCPKCGTAFRITQTQLQSANGAVRCGSCLNVFKAMEYLVASKPAEAPKAVEPQAKPETPTVSKTVARALPAANKPTADKPTVNKPPVNPTTVIASTPTPAKAVIAPKTITTPEPLPSTTTKTPANKPEQLAILSSIKPLPISPTPVAETKPATNPTPKPAPKKPVVRVLDKSSLAQTDDILISDDMDESRSETKSYEFDSFMDIDTTPKSEVSLFERKIRQQDEREELHSADESWAEMLIDEDDEDTRRFSTRKAPVISSDENDFYANERTPEPEAKSFVIEEKPAATPGLVFSLIAEEEPQNVNPATEPNRNKADDDFILSDELANIPDHSGFKSPITATPDNNLLDPTIFETPDESSTGDDSSKRQVKTQPKIRSYDGSRTALLMNIIPAPIEFTAKRMRRWYQRKLWPTLSLLALVALVVQLAWFKFDHFSRIEPYRTAYLFLCPYLKCQVPALVDKRQISVFNLTVRDSQSIPGVLEIDVMIMNNAAFDQPYPDLDLVFADLDEKVVASRRFAPNEYLGGEAAGSTHMPQKTPVHLTFDLVDPGENAVNYHVNVVR